MIPFGPGVVFFFKTQDLKTAILAGARAGPMG